MKTTCLFFLRLAAASIFLVVTWTVSLAQCGTERWKIKTLNDPEASAINFTPVTSTVHKQVVLVRPTPYHDDNPRAATEKRVYQITCILVKYKKEDDKDWHLVIKDLNTSEEMVIEIPDPSCTEITNSHLAGLAALRTKIRNRLGSFTTSFKSAPANMKVRVTGVGFFDKPNHPAGFSGRELHPVFKLDFL